VGNALALSTMSTAVPLVWAIDGDCRADRHQDDGRSCEVLRMQVRI
jgi:hypothetical protein